MEQLVVAVLAVAIGAWLFRRWRFRAKYDWHRIPEPPGWPIVGHLPYFLGGDKPQMHLKLLEWMKAMGRVVKVEVPGLGRMVFVADPAEVQGRINGHGAHGLPKSKLYLPFKRMSPDGHNNILTSSEPDAYWKAVRKGMAPAFGTKPMEASFQKILPKVQQLVDTIKRTPPQDPINFQALLPCFTLDAVGLAGYGIDFNTVETGHSDFFDTFNYCLNDIVSTAINPLHKVTKWLLPWGKLATESKVMFDRLYAEYYQILGTLRQRGRPTEDDMSIWGCISRIRDPATNSLLDDEHLVSEIGFTMVAAMDTTAQQTTWTLLAIAALPEVQTKVVEELKQSAVFQCVRSGKFEEVAYSDVMGLKYLTAVVKEAIRMFPMLPQGSSRVNTEDGSRVCGYRMPKDTIVWGALGALSQLPDLWDEPDTFKPERWLIDSACDDEKNDGDVSKKGATRTLWGFSCGPRDCIGQRLAMVEMNLMLVFLLSNFTFRLAARMGSWKECVSRQCNPGILCVHGGAWLHCDARHDSN